MRRVGPQHLQFMKLQSLAIGAALAAVIATPAFAAKLGDPAAPLKINEWVKGKEVDVTDGKAIYVVEFWATWCGPCKASIPHLSKLQTENPEITFIGQDCWENDPSAVKGFVK